MKVYFPQYYDWWFDSAIEFLGHLLESVTTIQVDWNEGEKGDESNK